MMLQSGKNVNDPLDCRFLGYFLGQSSCGHFLGISPRRPLLGLSSREPLLSVVSLARILFIPRGDVFRASITKGLITRERHDLRSLPVRILVLVYVRPVQNKLGPVSPTSGVGPTRLSSDRFELGSTKFSSLKLKSLQINHLCGKK